VVDKNQVCVKIGKSANEMLALLTLACGEYIMKNLSVLNGIGGSIKSEKMCSQFKTVLFGDNWIIHYEFTAQGQTVKTVSHIFSVST
jgi:hypothetical protein